MLDLESETYIGSALHLHLNQLGAIPRLTSEEVIQLAKIMEKNRDDERLTSRARAARRQRWLAARNKIVNANLRLAVAYAKSWLSRIQQQGQSLELSDLVQEATFGLIRAAEKFDYRRGYEFSTYADGWLRQKLQAIERGMEDRSGQMIRVPAGVHAALPAIRRARNELVALGSQDPTYDQIARRAGVKPSMAENALDHAQMSRLSLDDAVAVEDKDESLGNRIADVSAREPESSAVQLVIRARLRLMVDALERPLQQVLILFYGLDDNTERPMREVARLLGVSRGMAENHLIQALKALRESERFGQEMNSYRGFDLGTAGPHPVWPEQSLSVPALRPVCV